MHQEGSPCNSGKRDVEKNVSLVIDGKKVDMVPFVNNILANTIIAVVMELDGYEEGSKIEIVLE